MDFASDLSSVISAVASVATLLTVYIAAAQLHAQYITTRTARSLQALGAWNSVVDRRSAIFSRAQLDIRTPVVSLSELVRRAQHLRVRAAGDAVDASWVEFLGGIGIVPEAREMYRLEVGAAIVNGVQAMRWRGTDLVGVAAILGFECLEQQEEGAGKGVMPLPMQWVSPLGWLQLRLTADGGCLAQFRPRMVPPPVVPQRAREYFQDMAAVQPMIETRAWQAINGLRLSDGRALVFNGSSTGGHLLRPEPGHLFRSPEGDMACCWGISPTSAIEVSPLAMPLERIDPSWHSFNGIHAMPPLLPMLKDALLRLTPDGYFLTAHRRFVATLSTLLQHVNNNAIEFAEFGAGTTPDQWARAAAMSGLATQSGTDLYYALAVVNATTGAPPGRVIVEDMKVMAKASVGVRRVLGGKQDLVWAMLYPQPKALRSFVLALRHMELRDIFMAKGKCHDGVLTSNVTGHMVFNVPLMATDEYSGGQFLAAVLDVLLTSAWVKLAWSNNVGCYNTGIHRDVVMT